MLKRNIWNLFFCLLFIIGFGLSYLIYKLGAPNEVKKKTVTIQKKIIISPSPTNLDISKYKINILNGNGKAGFATEIKLLLEQQGFIVISTNNADSFDYKNTKIIYSEDINNEYISKLSKVLQDRFAKIETEINNEKVGLNGIEIIIGLEKN